MSRRARHPAAALAVAALAALLAGAGAAPGLAATFTVNAVDDTHDVAPGDGVCADGNGVCTLRAAVEEANALPSADTIAFAVPFGGVPTIFSQDLTLTQPVTIDGTTQPGGARVVLQGDGAGHVAFTLAGGNATLLGLDLEDYGLDAVLVQSSNNVVEQSVITRSGLAGIEVASGTGNRISKNSIVDNRGLGIDLGNNQIVDPNDNTEADGIQNFPLFVNASTDMHSTDLNFSLHSTPQTTFAVEVFANTNCDASGNGEGETFLGTISVHTDGGGDGMGTLHLPVDPPNLPALLITATATGPGGATSEFGPCVLLNATVETTTTTTITVTTTQPGQTTTTTTTTTTSTTTTTAPGSTVCVKGPAGLAIDGAGTPFISDFISGSVVGLDVASKRFFTTHTGLNAPNDIDINACTLFIGEPRDVKIQPLTVTGVLRDFDDEILANARISLVGSDGHVSKPVTTAADGSFSIPFEVLGCSIAAGGYLEVQTPGTATKRPRTVTTPFQLHVGTRTKPLGAVLMDVKLKP